MSNMPQQMPAAAGSVNKYNMDGTLDDNFAAIGVADGSRNAGLAINSDASKLYVTSGSSVMEYSLTDAGATVSQTFDLSAHMQRTNGLCLSHDDALLYVTEPGMEMAMGSWDLINSEGVPSALVVITVATGEVAALFSDSPDHSPNGCVVLADDPNVVYMINFAHGVNAWNRNSGAQSVSWGSDLQAIQTTEGDVRAGDGLAYYNGVFYASLWRMTGMPPTAICTIYSCSAMGTTCTQFSEVHGADLQVDLRDADRPILISPSLREGKAYGIELPLPSSDENGVGAGTETGGGTGGANGDGTEDGTSSTDTSSGAICLSHVTTMLSLFVMTM